MIQPILINMAVPDLPSTRVLIQAAILSVTTYIMFKALSKREVLWGVLTLPILPIIILIVTTRLTVRAINSLFYNGKKDISEAKENDKWHYILSALLIDIELMLDNMGRTYADLVNEHLLTLPNKIKKKVLAYV